MTKKNQVLEASEERIYLLDKLSVPPKNYGMFLVDIVKSFEGFVLKEGKADSLEELAEKHRNRLMKLNPDKPKEDFSQRSAMALAVYAELQFDKGHSIRESERPYRSTKYTESLFSPHSEFIPLEDSRNSILNYVKEFKEKLDQRYPKRHGQLSNNLSHRKTVGNGIYNFIRGFELKLRLDSNPIYLLEGDVSLIDHGSTSSKNIIEWYCTPAIRVRARGFGNVSVIKRFGESLGNKVQKTYAFDRVVSSSTYEFSK